MYKHQEWYQGRGKSIPQLADESLNCDEITSLKDDTIFEKDTRSCPLATTHKHPHAHMHTPLIPLKKNPILQTSFNTKSERIEM